MLLVSPPAKLAIYESSVESTTPSLVPVFCPCGVVPSVQTKTLIPVSDAPGVRRKYCSPARA